MSETPDAPLPPPPPPVSPALPAPPRRRRWKRILLITGGVLLGLLLLAALLLPPLIGMILRSKLPSTLAEELSAEVTLDDASFSWPAQVELYGLRIIPSGFRQPLLDLRQAKADVALFAALGGSYIADVELDGPQVTIERDAQGRFNYEVPPKPSTPSDPGEPGEPKEEPVIRATIRIREGTLRVLDAGRQETRFSLTAEARVDGLDRIRATASLTDPDGGALTAKLEGKTADVDIQRLSLTQLSPAARVFGEPSLELAGRLGGTLRYTLEPIQGKTELTAEGVDVRHRGRAYALDRLSLTHEGSLDEKGNGPQKIRLNAGPLLALELDAQVRERSGAQTTLDLRVELGEAVELLKRAGLIKADLTAKGGVNLRGTVSAFPLAWDLKSEGRTVELTLEGKRSVLEGVSHESRGSIDDAGNGRASLRVHAGRALDLRLDAALAELYQKPAVEATLEGASDVGELSRLLEKAVGLKAALEGRSTIQARLRSKGRDASLQLKAEAKDLAAVDASRKKIPLDPEIRLELDAAWKGESRTAELGRLSLTSSFATIEGRGGATFGDTLALRASTLSLDADLAGLAAKLGTLLEKPPALAGRALLRAKAEGEKVSLDGDFKGVRARGYGPLDATLRHEGTIDAKGDGRHVLRLDSANAITADVEAERKAGAVALKAVMKADLGALAAALPGLIELKPGVSLAGQATLTGNGSLNGKAAAFDVRGELAGLAAVERKERVEVDPLVTFAAAGAWDGAKKDLDLRTLTLRSSMATADAKGGFTLTTPLAIRESSFSLGADLGRIGAKLRVMLNDPPALAGLLDAKGAYAAGRYELTASASALKVGANGPIDATLVQAGKLALGAETFLEIERGELKSSAVIATLSGALQGRQGELALRATVRPAELSQWIPDLGLAGEPIPVDAKLTLNADGLRAEGRSEVPSLTRTKDGVVSVLRLSPASFDVQRKGEAWTARVRSERVEWDSKGTSLKAGLEADAAYGPKGTSGVTKLVNLEVVDEKKNAVKEAAVTLTHDVGMSPGAWEIRKAEIQSGLLRGGLRGSLKNLETEPEFAGIRGSFRYHPDRLGAVLKPFMKGALSGAEEKSITLALDGKAKSLDVLSLLQGSTGTVEVEIARFTHTGVTLSGKAAMKVEKGMLRTTSPLDVNQGRTEMNATIDLREAKERPQSAIDFTAKDVDANADMAPFLASINPVFHTVNGAVAGKSTADFKLIWRGPIDPATKDWEKAAAPALFGSGRLAVRDLVITGSPAVGQIMQALGEGNELRGELLGTDVRIQDGACHYTNMTLRLARYELRFTGYVTFDKKLKLTVEMPLTPGIRKRYPNLEKYTGQTLFVTLGGTASSPRLDVEAAIQELIKRAVPNLLEDALKKVLEREKKKRDKDN